MKIFFAALLVVSFHVVLSTGMIIKISPENGEISAARVLGMRGLREDEFKFRGLKENNGKKDCHKLTFTLSKGRNVKADICPETQEISFRKSGISKGAITDEERAYLVSLAESLQNDDTVDTDTVDSTGTLSSRAALILSEWPETFDVDWDFDMEKENAHHADRDEKMAGRDPPSGEAPQVPGDDGRVLAGLVSVDGDRKLGYVSLCSSYNTYYEVTHDDFWYNRGNDRTTYYAHLDMNAGGSCSDGTYFWTGSAWSCYEPDHASNIEWAYGQCFGRCGGGCGSNTQFTQDCADHDSCVRFGHSLASFWCDDEFSFTIDDALFAPNCL